MEIYGVTVGGEEEDGNNDNTCWSIFKYPFVRYKIKDTIDMGNIVATALAKTPLLLFFSSVNEWVR